MPANRFGIDLADIYKNIETIKGQKATNRLNTLKLDEAERVAKERPEKERLAKQRNTLLTQKRGEAATGNLQAQRELLQLDPEGGPKFIEAVNKMDDRQKEATSQKIEELGSMVGTILHAAPERQPALYQELMQSVPEGARGSMPPEFDQPKIMMAIAKLRKMDDILQAPDVKQVGGEDVVYRDGIEIERKKRPVKKVKGENASGLTPTQELAIKKFEHTKGKDQKTALYRAFAGLAKAEVSPNGNVIIFKDQQEKWNQALTRASRMLADGKETDIEQAALKAAQHYGIAGASENTRKFNLETGKIE